MSNDFTFVLAFIVTMFNIIFYMLGKYSERISWNNLIREEKINKPLDKKR